VAIVGRGEPVRVLVEHAGGIHAVTVLVDAVVADLGGARIHLVVRVVAVQRGLVAVGVLVEGVIALVAAAGDGQGGQDRAGRERAWAWRSHDEPLVAARPRDDAR